jgi:hypothetical protein
MMLPRNSRSNMLPQQLSQGTCAASLDSIAMAFMCVGRRAIIDHQHSSFSSFVDPVSSAPDG